MRHCIQGSSSRAVKRVGFYVVPGMYWNQVYFVQIYRPAFCMNAIRCHGYYSFQTWATIQERLLSVESTSLNTGPTKNSYKDLSGSYQIYSDIVR